MRSKVLALFPALALVSLLALVSAAGATSAFGAWSRFDPASQTRVDHGPWADFLDRFVTARADGLHVVAYSRVGSEDRARLDDYLADLQATRVSALSRDEQMAYWMNLYNAATVRVVLDHWPVESITEIHIDGGEGPWNAELVRVEGRGLSLNDIENRILRPIWNDPRIHYGVNCASYGCPNLALEPFTAENLEDLLDRGAEAFVNHERAVRFAGEKLVLSSLYLWYASDFGEGLPGVLEHLAEFADEELADRLETFRGEVEYTYDWSLNRTSTGDGTREISENRDRLGVP